MALNIAALFLVAAITFMHSMFGLFSGLINVLCTIVAMCVAFGFYTPLNDWMAKDMEFSPAYSEPIALMMLFFVTLLALRSLADQFIRGNVHINQYADWGGGAVCGFVNGQIAVGMLAIGSGMLPLGDRVMMFQRYERSNTTQAEHEKVADFKRNTLWLRSDEFATGLFSILSSGSLRSDVQFATVYPNFTDAMWYSNNTVQPQNMPVPYRDKRNGDGNNALKLDSWWEVKGPLEARYREEVPTERVGRPQMSPMSFKAASGMKIIGVRLTLGAAAADKNQTSKLHLFRASTLRLVGKRGDDTTQYTPIALAGHDKELAAGAIRVVDLDTNVSMEGSDQTIDVYYEVPDDFMPSFVEYKRHARTAMNTGPAKAAPGELVKATTPSATGGPSRGGAPQFFWEGNSGVNFALPFEFGADELKRGSGQDLRIESDKLAFGRIFGRKEAFEAQPNKNIVKDFAAPDGWRLVQIKYNPKKAASIVGDVFNYAARLNQYKVVDNNGNSYLMVGYWAVVKRGGKDFFEIYYDWSNDGGQTGPGAANHSMLDFKEISANEYNADDSTVTLLFLVKSNSQLTKLENQKGESKDINFNVP